MQPAAEQLARWWLDPVQAVRDLFQTEPDPAQRQALTLFPKSPRICLKACTGSGKTAVLAWIGWIFMLTRPHPMVGATSISGDNLKANLWTELARWRARCPLLEQQFEFTKTVIFHRMHPSTWKIEARTWSKDADPSQIGNALRGLHAPYVLWLLDETGDYPDSILPIAEAIFSGEPTEAHIVQAGNPLKLAGPLYRASTSARSSWVVIEITADPDDPNRTPRVSVEHAREQIRLYGRDNPWVLVNIFGKFPPSSLNVLIGPDEVSAAMKRYYREHEIGNAAKVLAADVARFGDDASAIARRQGLQMFPFGKYRNLTSTQGAGQVARLWNDWDADACFIDATGGMGWGWIDQLRTLGKAPIAVEFAAEAHDKNRYYNKRTEMYFDLVDWIKRGGALPESNELLAALTQTTYTFKGDRLLLEPKDIVKQKLGYSPDEADAAAMTFAEPVAPRERSVLPARKQAEYKPFADLDRALDTQYAADSRHDPFRG
jgi:phage terminase large subunit